MLKLAIIITHPIQYFSPLFCLLQNRDKLQIKVFYTWERGSESFDKGFGKKVAWDIPLLEGYEYCFVPNNGQMKKGFWNVRNPLLNSEIEQWGAEAIMVFGWNYLSHLRAMIYFKGRIPVLFRGDSHLLNKKGPIKAWLRKIWLSWVYKHIDYGVFVGTNNKNYYLQFGLKENQLVFAPHAIDNARFSDSIDKKYEQSAADWRIQLGYSKEDIVFGYIGKLEDVKNPNLLLNAFKQLTRQEAKLLFVGNGHLENQLKENSENEPRVQFLGFQNQSVMPILHRVLDVLVLPSKSETWGLTINEAMACGRPVIVSSQVGCAIDLVKNGQNGYIFESGMLNDLLGKMELLIESRGVNNKMGKASQKIIKDWSFPKLAMKLEEHLKRISK